jgi:signal transduction histidine kinase
VLVAEDEPALLEAYTDLVIGMGHECVYAYDGEHALELARQHHPDLVITDYMMPGRTGIELMRSLRIDPALDHVPVILLSAARPPERERRDAWAFMSKPVPIQRLESAITEALAAAAYAKTQSAAVRAVPGPDAHALSLAREDMLSWVSHEIKSPLAAALTATELALRDARGPEPGSSEKRLVTIARQLRRMDELVTSLLDAAQLQDGQLTLERETFEFASVVESAVTYWRELHPEVVFETMLSDRPSLMGDAERLRQIIDNLLSNAIKYGRPANRIEVGVAVDDRGRVRLTVADHGRGIPREQLPHIFDRFHRVPGQGGRGHGLGLYIAAALARLHGGLLDVESQFGHGAKFTLVLPLEA